MRGWAVNIALALPLAALGAGVVDLSPLMQDKLRHGHRGDLLALPDFPAVPIARLALPGPPLLFSDRPEYVGGHNGILLQEDVPAGAYRLYLYHVPGTTNSARTISAVVENRSARALTLTFQRYAFPPPGIDYPEMGVEGLMEFFTGKDRPAPILIAPGATGILDPKLDETVAQDPQLIHAFYEFTIDEPARVAVLQKDPGAVTTNVYETLPKLPRTFARERSSGAGRGLFPTSEFFVTNAPGTIIDSAQGFQRLALAGWGDRWAAGKDGISGGAATTNVGNYGVIYHAHLSYVSTDGRPIALLAGSPERRGGWNARPKAAIEVNDGIWKGGWVAVTGKGRRPPQAWIVEVVQEFPAPAPGETGTIDLTYSPPGGSSSPTPFYLAPFDP